MTLDELIDAVAAKYEVEVHEFPDRETKDRCQEVLIAALAEVGLAPDRVSGEVVEHYHMPPDDVFIRAANIALGAVGSSHLSEAEQAMFRRNRHARVRLMRLYRVTEAEKPYYEEILRCYLGDCTRRTPSED